MSRLEKFKADHKTARMRGRLWFFGGLSFGFLAWYAHAQLDSAYGTTLAIVTALGCLFGATVCALREREAFDNLWLEAGLTPAEVEKKWQELHPPGV